MLWPWRPFRTLYFMDDSLIQKLILKIEILIADWRRAESLAPIGRAKENLASK